MEQRGPLYGEREVTGSISLIINWEAENVIAYPFGNCDATERRATPEARADRGELPLTYAGLRLEGWAR